MGRAEQQQQQRSRAPDRSLSLLSVASERKKLPHTFFFPSFPPPPPPILPFFLFESETGVEEDYFLQATASLV